MKAYRLLRITLLMLLCGGTLMSVSCGDILISSVKTGLFSFVSGSVTTTLGGGQLADFLTNLGGNSGIDS